MENVITIPFFFIHGFLVSGTAFFGQHWREQLPTNVLNAALDLAAACGCFAEDALNGCDAVSVSKAARVRIVQPRWRQGVLLGRHLLMQLDEEGQHALSDLQDFCHQLGGGAWWNPTCRRAFRPHNLRGFCVAAVYDLLKLSPALCHKTEYLSFPQVLKIKKKKEMN